MTDHDAPRPWSRAFWSDARYGFRWGFTNGLIIGCALAVAVCFVALATGRSIFEP